MAKYLLKRLLLAVLVLFVVIFVAFFLIRLVPGDPVENMMGSSATDEQIEAAREAMGYNKPIIVQFGIYLKNALTGDLGNSIFYRQSCLKLIANRFGATVQLCIGTMVVALLISIPLGIVAGVKKGTAADVAATFVSILGNALSPVWVGLVLILFFGVQLRWLPAQGYGSIKHLILPALTAGLTFSSYVLRQLRSSLFSTLQEDYITATYARGVRRMKVYRKYALKNAILPVITVIGVGIAQALAGSAVVEVVFGWPGIGSLLVDAMGSRDYPLVQACIIVSTMIFVVANILVDIAYTIADPRTRIAE